MPGIAGLVDTGDGERLQSRIEHLGSAMNHEGTCPLKLYHSPDGGLGLIHLVDGQANLALPVRRPVVLQPVEHPPHLHFERLERLLNMVYERDERTANGFHRFQGMDVGMSGHGRGEVGGVGVSTR